jgi:hypothetical protein
MPLLEVFIQGKFIVPTKFKRQMNEYELPVEVMAKIGGYELKNYLEKQEKMDNCYDQTGEGDKLGVYHKRYSVKN